MTRPIRTVGLISPRYAPAIGGVEKHVREIALGLVKLGIQVEVITTDPTHQLPPKEMLEGVLVHRFRTIFNDSIFFLSPRLGMWLSKNARRFDVLHAHSYHTPLALQAAMAAQQHRIPLVLTPAYHGTGHSWLRRLLHVPYRIPGRWLVRQAKWVICVSETEQSLVARHFGSDVPIEVVPNGVDWQRIVAAKPFPKREGIAIILAVGRLEAYKQVDRLLFALTLLPPMFAVVIIGSGTAQVEIECLITKLGLECRVRMLGNVSQNELESWYRTADVVVSLSRYESFGITVLEGAVAGAPVVASDISAHREVAAYVPERRVLPVNVDCAPEQLAERIQEAYLQNRAGDITHWPVPTWEQCVSRVLACYQTAV
jgi:glycosyltransferase involved in cell wall biosynthesis